MSWFGILVGMFAFGRIPCLVSLSMPPLMQQTHRIDLACFESPVFWHAFLLAMFLLIIQVGVVAMTVDFVLACVLDFLNSKRVALAFVSWLGRTPRGRKFYSVAQRGRLDRRRHQAEELERVHKEDAELDAAFNRYALAANLE